MQRRSLAALALLAAAWFAGSLAAQEVTLPLERYEALRHAAEATPTPVPTPSPGAPWAIERATISVELGQASARLRTRLWVRLLASGWQTLTVPQAGRLLEADMGGLRGRMEQAGSLWKIHARGPGAATVSLTSVAPVEPAARAGVPTWTLAFTLPRAAVVRLTTTLPERLETLEVASGGVLLAREGRRVEILGRPGSRLELRLLGRSEAGPVREDRLFVAASTCSLVRLAASRTRVTAWIQARRLSGSLQFLRAGIPPGLSVVSVEGDVSAWRVQDGTLRIVPTDPDAPKALWKISLTAAPSTELTTPILIPEVSSLRTVAAAVQAEDDAFVEIADPGSAHLASPSEWADLIPDFRAATSAALLLADPARPPKWKITRTQGGRLLAAQVDSLVVDAMIGDGTTMASQCWASVRSSGATLLGLTLPEGARLLRASRNGIDLIPGTSGRTLQLPIAAQKDPQVLFLEVLVPQPPVPERGTFTIPLPAASAPITRVAVRTVLPPGMEAVPPPDRAARGPVPPPSTPPLGHLPGEEAGILSRVAGVPPVLARRSLGFFPLPPGYHAVWSSWETLSQEPGNLHLHVERTSPRKEWF